MKKVIITGASGFLGGALAKKLLQQGCIVYGVGSGITNLTKLESYGNFVPVIANFTRYFELDKLITERNFDVFYHFAWQGVFGNAFRDYRLQLSNAEYTCDALIQAKYLGCKKFVFAGTYNEFEIRNFINRETFKPRYTCIYATSKLAAELICKTLAYHHDIYYSAGLVCMAYGEGNNSQMLANVVLNQLNNGIEPKLIEGNNLYDMIYIDDIADAFAAIGESGANQRSYYVGHRNLRKFRDLFLEIRDVVSPGTALHFGAYQDTADMDYSLIDLDALYRDTGFECKADFRESIIKTAQWLKSVEGKA